MNEPKKPPVPSKKPDKLANRLVGLGVLGVITISTLAGIFGAGWAAHGEVPPKIETRVVEKKVEVPVEKIVEKEVIKEVPKDITNGKVEVGDFDGYETRVKTHGGWLYIDDDGPLVSGAVQFTPDTNPTPVPLLP